MPPPSSAQLQLIRDYEPILFFHPEERFFPSDAKRYLEECALWKASAPFENNPQWGGTPVVPAGQLRAKDNEGGVFLGKGLPNGPFDFLQTPPDKECFLDMAGWNPPGTPFPPVDGYTNVDRIAERYRTDPALIGSQFWYHAEFFDKARLTALFGLLAGGNNFMDLFARSGGSLPKLNDAALICYYLFFPGHDDGLAGCVGVPEAKEYASFAGEWACVAVVLDRPTPTDVYAPKWVGLTNRNIGIIKFNGEEVRIGMRLFPWSATDGTHIRVQVAKGSHALYLPGQVPERVVPLTAVDPSAGSCGLAAPPTGHTSQIHLAGISGASVGGIVLAKVFGGAAAGSVLGPFAPAGWIAGLAWGLIEGGGLGGSNETVTTVTEPPPSLSPTVDLVSTSGKVYHPKGLPPPDIDPANAFPWKSEDGHKVEDRIYDSTVIRETQVLWPDDFDTSAKGYTGRWGPRVASAAGTADLQLRRAGMKFPTFWYMVFDSLVRRDRPPVVISLPPGGTTWTVPVDWNNTNNSIELVGAGGGGGGGGGATNTPGNSGGTGGGGGGAGGYAKTTNLALEPGVITYQIGAAGSPGLAGGVGGDGGAGKAGGDTWFNGNTLATATAGAKGGSGGGVGISGDGAATGGAGGAGGPAASGVGEVKNSGGAGGAGGVSSPTAAGGSGGGGGGAAGAGGPAGTASGAGNGNVGAAGENSGGKSGAGGSGDASKGGAGGVAADANTNGVAGSAGTEWNPTLGSGGGGSGGGAGFGGPGHIGGAGGTYGAGGGGGGGGGYITQPGGDGAAGQPGVIIISYTP